MKICIIIPVYNEEAVIQNNLGVILKHAKELPTRVTVVAVNDGSSDHSEEILKQVAARYSQEEFWMISYSDNRGYGGALKAGMKFAIEHNYDYAVFMDSDLTDHPKYLQIFYEKMLAGYDYIKTTRHISAGGYKDVPWKRRIISKVGCEFAKLVSGLPLTDLANGFRAVKVDVLKKINLKENHFAIIIEELMKAKKFTNSFCEIPRTQGVRGAEARSSAFTYDFRTYRKYLKYLFFN